MSKDLIFSQISIDELESRIVERIKTELKFHDSSSHHTNDEFLTANETAKLLGVSVVSIHTWKRKGLIKFHRFGSRIRFKKSDIIDSPKSGLSNQPKKNS